MVLNLDTRVTVAVAVLLLTSAPMGADDDRGRSEQASPIAISPGSARGEQIHTPCPVFTWTPVEDVRSYELRVYRLLDGERAEVVLEHVVEGAAMAWTPPLAKCLELGGRYAWSVRGLAATTTRWSAPTLFEVAQIEGTVAANGATASEEDHSDAQSSRAAGVPADPQPGAQAAAGPEIEVPEGTPPPSTVEPAEVAAIAVEGSVAATTFQYNEARDVHIYYQANDFKPDNDTDTTVVRFIGGYARPVGSAQIPLERGVRLPEGADVTEVRCYYYDNDIGESDDWEDVDLYFYSRALDSTIWNELAAVQGSPGVLADSIVRSYADTTVIGLGDPIDNENYSYRLRVLLDLPSGTTSPGSSLRFYGCRLTYSLFEASAH